MGIKQQESIFQKIQKEKIVQDALSRMNPETKNHSIRVAFLCFKIGRDEKLKTKKLEILVRSAFLHDIGKISTPISVLNKIGKIDDEEKEIIRFHPKTAFKILNSLGLKDEAEIVVSHHEFQKDSYPRNNKELQDKNKETDEINKNSEILASADSCDSLLNKRSYKEAFNKKETFEILKDQFTGNLKYIKLILQN